MHHKSTIVPPIPAEIARTARSVFGRTNFYILLGEQIPSIVEATRLEHLAALVDSLNMPGTILPLVTFFQFVEGLTDDQALAALQGRTDWKFALHTPVRGPLLTHDVLCAFRNQVIVQPACQPEFQSLVDKMVPLNLPASRRAEDFHVLSMMMQVCSNNRMELLKVSLVAAIQAMAIRFPQALRQIALPHWYGLYNKLAPIPNPSVLPGTQELRTDRLYRDASYLLSEVERSNDAALRLLIELVELREIWQWICETQSEPPASLAGSSFSYDCNKCIRRRRGAQVIPNHSLNMFHGSNLES